MRHGVYGGLGGKKNGYGIVIGNGNEVDEMTEYFKNDIKNIDNELIRIKKHILSMQQSLKNKY